MGWQKFASRAIKGAAGFFLIGIASTGVVLGQQTDRKLEKPGENQAVSLSQVKVSLRDVWGEAAMRQPNGASYEFFEPLLPPLRYVHADFHHYPIVLSGPRSKAKARLISSGAGVNQTGGTRSWKEIGTPVVFRVGFDEFRFGGLIDRLSHPEPLEGWLPIYSITYQHASPVQAEGLVPIDQQPQVPDPEIYRLEAFVSTDQAMADHAVVFVRFSLAAGKQGSVTVQCDSADDQPPRDGKWLDGEQKAIVGFDSRWRWERRRMHAKLSVGDSAVLAIATIPIDPDRLTIDLDGYDRHRKQTIDQWKATIESAMAIRVAEPRINEAWRNLLVQNWQLIQGDRMFYSASNQYEQLYVTEGGDAALATLYWGYDALAKEVMLPILDYRRVGLEHHQAGLKLLDLAKMWWITRDRHWFRANRQRWQPELERLMHRSTDHLLPKERYCGDIATPIHALSVEAKAWRALHDWSAVLDELGETELARRVASYAADLKPKLIDVLMRSVRRETQPPFLPNALLDREEAHTPITATRIGSYWNLMTGFFMESRLFPPGSEEEKWVPEYLESHGGLCMGMTRTGGTAHGFWTGSERTNPLYTTRYFLDTLRRDQPERGLVSFYGMLAHGFTRSTLIAGEASTLEPVDAYGRFFYCPPNSAGNAHFLTMLRHLLVQEWDRDDDGRPETLQLLSAGSKRWLEDGKEIELRDAPTAFGKISLMAKSEIEQGKVMVELDLPQRNIPEHLLVQPQLPDGWRVVEARVGDRRLPIIDQRGVDLAREMGKVTVVFFVQAIDR